MSTISTEKTNELTQEICIVWTIEDVLDVRLHILPQSEHSF
ncbi:TPA: hypothetical protein ACM2VO_002432 [Legionella pneumophila]